MGKNTEQFISKKSSSRGAPLFFALLAMLSIFAVGMFIVVMSPPQKKDPVFKAKAPSVNQQKEIEHKLNVSEYSNAASATQAIEKIALQDMLTDLPIIPLFNDEQFPAFDNDMSLFNSESLLAHSGLSEALNSMINENSKFSFMGIEESGSRVVIVFDISTSVISNIKKSGLDISGLQSEILKLVNDFNYNTHFNIIQHSRSYDCFQDHLIPANNQNKAVAKEWITKEFRTNGRGSNKWKNPLPNGIQAVLEAAFKMEPEIIFLLSDASYQRSTIQKKNENVPWKELNLDIKNMQSELIDPARIHYISFGANEENGKEAKRLSARYKGSYKEFKKKS